MRRLRSARSAANQDDQPRMRPASGKLQKVISVAREHQQVLSLSILEHLLIQRFDVKDGVQFHCVMALSAKRSSNRCGNVMIEEEAHKSLGAFRHLAGYQCVYLRTMVFVVRKTFVYL